MNSPEGLLYPLRRLDGLPEVLGSLGVGDAVPKPHKVGCSRAFILRANRSCERSRASSKAR